MKRALLALGLKGAAAHQWHRMSYAACSSAFAQSDQGHGNLNSQMKRPLIGVYAGVDRRAVLRQAARR
jgi:hypothetical protein